MKRTNGLCSVFGSEDFIFIQIIDYTIFDAKNLVSTLFPNFFECNISKEGKLQDNKSS